MNGSEKEENSIKNNESYQTYRGLTINGKQITCEFHKLERASMMGLFVICYYRLRITEADTMHVDSYYQSFAEIERAWVDRINEETHPSVPRVTKSR